ncbi:hypothetical protein [Moritella sp. Urea-trap-13]|uniref:hypothetical protein n=1 Tax=Moritella sp. Urea-trap-13 TaxID=2058327 RepID=UPI000C34F310|nr:hypothetical protein [Moritella sp. Urea-trap-13]PKH05809.1 hypothetical protein CXF93_15815 [Moritella sp. Urea-trap-13]
MSKWLTAGVSIISIAAVGYFNFFYQAPQDLNRIQLPLQQDCRVNQQECLVQLTAEHTISLSITPFNAKPMTPLSVNLNGAKIDNASVTINGVNMAMPGFPTALNAVDKNTYQAETALAICTVGEMLWQADLTIIVAGQPYLVPFQFITTTH